MPFIKANNVNLYYEQHGQGEDILLISGLSADHNAWALILPELCKKYRVTVFDNRGAGQSEVPSGKYHIAQMAEDVFDLITKLNINSAHVVGHSMGGMITEQLALISPEKVKSLCIVCSKATPYARSKHWLELSYQMRQKEVDIPIMIDYGFSIIFGNEFISNSNNVLMWRELLMANEHPQTLEGFQSQLHATTTYNALESLKNIKQRTLVLAGEDDLLTPLKLSKQIQSAIPNAELKTLPSGHMPNIECPEVLAETIKDWVA